MAVYFIQCGEGGPVKIGFATCVRSRMSKMQSDTPAELRLLAAYEGTKADEARVHGALVAHRLRGEWFAPHADVIGFKPDLPTLPPKRRLFTNKPMSGETLENFRERHAARRAARTPEERAALGAKIGAGVRLAAQRLRASRITRIPTGQLTLEQIAAAISSERAA